MTIQNTIVIEEPLNFAIYHKVINFVNHHISDIDEYTFDTPFKRWTSETGTIPFMRITINITDALDTTCKLLSLLKEIQNDR